MPKWHPRMLISPGYPGIPDVKRQAWVVHKTKSRSPSNSEMMPYPSNPLQVPLLKTQGIFTPSLQSDRSSPTLSVGGDMPFGGPMGTPFGLGMNGGMPFDPRMSSGMPFKPGMGGMMGLEGLLGSAHAPDMGQHGRMDHDPLRGYNTVERYPPGDPRRKS